MPCKIMFLRQVTSLWSLALTTVLCLVGKIVVAQTPDTLQTSNLRILKPVVPAKKKLNDILSQVELHKYSSIVESINKRTLFLKQSGAGDSSTTGIMQSILGRSPYAGMKDSAMGEFLHYVGNNFGKERLVKIVKSFTTAGDSTALQQFIGKKLKGFYAIKGKEAFDIPSFENLLNNDFNGARYSVIRDNTALTPSSCIHQWQVADDLRIMDVPFHIEFSNLSDSYVPLRYSNLVKFSFNKDAFRQGLKSKLDKYYDLEKYLLNDIDMLSYVKKHFEQELTAQVAGFKTSLIQDPHSMLLSKISYDELLKLDIDQVKEKIMPAAKIQPLRDQLTAYEEVITKQGKSMLPAQKDSLIQIAKSKADYIASLEQMVAKIGDVKNKLSTSGINANDITRLQQSANAQTLKKWQQPGTIKEAAENLLPQNGFQRFFKDITALNVGTFGANKSERTINALLSGGLQIEALKKNNLLSGGFGKIKDAGFLKDAGLQNSLFAPPVSMQYAQLGKGATGNNNTHITVLNGNTFSPNTLNYQAMSMARNMFVGTISKTINVRKSGTVEAELSKSATQFRNTGGITPDQAMEHKSALYSYADDLLQTLSVGVRYQDNWDKIGLTHNVRMAYAGFGYNNPGNPSASRGSLQYDVQLRKYVEKRKGFIQVQYANRNYNYSADGGQRWKNLQLNLQARYRFSRNVTLGGRLNQYQLVRKTPAGKEKMYVSRKIAADGQLSSDVWGVSQRTMLSLGLQQFDNIYVQSGGNSSLLLFQWVTSVPLQKIQATASIFYNKELTENKFIGDQFNGELGIGYALLKKVMVNSSLTYLDNKMAARQIGTRQSINTAVFKNCMIGLYVDWRKNLVTPVNPYLYGNFRGELSVHYLIK